MGFTRAPSAVDSADDFAAWVRPHRTVMAQFATRLVGRSGCDDVVQEALIAAWSKWSSYDAARGTVRMWLLAIVADRARKSRRRLPLPLPDVAAHTDRSADLDVERAVAALPPRQRMAVELHRCAHAPASPSSSPSSHKIAYRRLRRRPAALLTRTERHRRRTLTHP